MANITTTQVNDGLATIVAQESLSRLRESIQLARLVNRDYEDEVAEYGQVVQITKRGSLTANAKSADSTVTLQTPADDKVSVTLDQHFETSFIIEDVAKALARPDYLSGYAMDGVEVIAEKVDTSISDLFASFSESVGAVNADLTRTVVTTARQKLKEANARGVYNFIIDPSQEQALLDDDDFVFADKTGRNTEFVEGEIGRTFGFDFYTNTNLPAVTGTPAAVENFAFHRDAIALVMRPLPMNEAPGMIQRIVSDPETGLGVRMTMSYDTGYLGVKVTLDALWGVAELRDSLGVRVLSQV